MNSKVILIASGRAPGRERFAEFAGALTSIASEDKLTLKGYLLVDGPGCVNHAIHVEGENVDIERFANGITMNLQPGKWSFTNDTVPAGFTDDREAK